MFLLLGVGRIIIASLLLVSMVDGQAVFESARLRPISVAASQIIDTGVIATFQLNTFNQTNLEMLLESSQQVESHAQNNLFSSNLTGKFRFGKSFSVDIDLMGFETIVSGQPIIRVWRMLITSPGASSLNFVFDRFRGLSRSGELYLVPVELVDDSNGRYSVQSGRIRGPFTWHNVKSHGEFATFPIDSDAVLVEYYDDSVEFTKPDIHISKIIHGFQSTTTSSTPLNPPPHALQSGPCNVDISCKLGLPWRRRQGKSVAMLLTDGGQAFCTGAMVNNAAQDGRQLFLTAFHCLSGNPEDPKHNMLLFNYESQSCGGEPGNPSNHLSSKMSVHGLRKLAAWSFSDFALFEVEEHIPDSYGVYLAGWTVDVTARPKSPVGIHHPLGDVKKISKSTQDARDSCWGWCRDGDDLPRNHWEVPRWDRGTTEPGSSGSPLFDSDSGLIVGQLHGGNAACGYKEGVDKYGKLSYSFNKSPHEQQRLQPYLDPESSGIVEMEGVELSAVRAAKPLFRVMH